MNGVFLANPQVGGTTLYSDSIVQSIEIDSGWSLYVFGEVFFSLVKLRVSQRINCLPTQIGELGQTWPNLTSRFIGGMEAPSKITGLL
jgi:hypothetical protein